MSTRLLRNRLIRLIGTIFIILATTIALLPYVARNTLVYLLKEQGLEQIRIENIDLNPFTARFAVYGLSASKNGVAVAKLTRGEGRLALRPLGDRRLLIEKLNLYGLFLTLEQQANSALLIAGLPLTQVQAESTAADTGWQVGIGLLSLDNSRLTYRQDKLLLDLHLDRLRISGLTPWAPQQAGRIEFNGRLSPSTAMRLHANFAPLASEPWLKGELGLHELQLKTFAPLIVQQPETLNGRLSVDGRINVRYRADQRVESSGQAQLKLANLQLTLEDNHLECAMLDVDGAYEFKTDPAQAMDYLFTGNLALQQGRFTTGTQTPPLLSLGRVQAEALHVRPHEVGIGALELGDLLLHLRRNEEGHWPLASAAPTGSEQTTPPRLRVDALQLRDGGRIKFEDHSLSPVYSETLQLHTLQMGTLDSHAPEQSTPFQLSGRIGEYSDLGLQGAFHPFASAPTFELNGQVRRFDLPPISPYLAPHLGYKLSSGQLDAELELKVADNQMHGNAQLTLRQPKVVVVNPEKMEQLKAQLGIPLETALYMLRDDEGDIHLQLPVTGRLDDPEFDISDAINTALGKTMKLTAVGYLKFILQPYSTLVSVVQLAGKAGAAMRLDPIGFIPGSVEPDTQTTAYLQKIASLLQEHPKLPLRLCGFATSADATAQNKASGPTANEKGTTDRLFALARTRANQIRHILVDQYQIKSEQIFICHPEIGKTPGALPRVELLL